MVLSDSLTAIQNSGQVLNRFCFGYLILAGLYMLDALPDAFYAETASQETVSFAGVAQFVLVFVLSIILGAIAQFLGRIEFKGKKYSERSFAIRAKRVGESRNVLLAEYFRDANSKYHMATGIVGVLLVLAVAVLISAIVGADPVILYRLSGPQAEIWAYGVVFVATAITSVLLRASALAGIDALDDILDEVDAKRNAQK